VGGAARVWLPWPSGLTGQPPPPRAGGASGPPCASARALHMPRSPYTPERPRYAHPDGQFWACARTRPAPRFVTRARDGFVQVLRPSGGGWPAADGLPHAGPGVVPGPARSVMPGGDDPPGPPRAIRSGRPAGRRGWHRLRRAGTGICPMDPRAFAWRATPQGGRLPPACPGGAAPHAGNPPRVAPRGGYISDYIVLTMRAAAAGSSLRQRDAQF
jgi:hypothetical protein